VNVKIVKPYKPLKKKWLGAFFQFARNNFGIVSIILFLILLVSESCYRTLLNKELHVLCIGGIASFLGFIILLPTLVHGHRKTKKYAQDYERRQASAYTVLTDEYLEKGLIGFWSMRYDWRLLSGYTETKDSFILDAGNEFVIIEKPDLQNQATLEDFRIFLKQKTQNSTALLPTLSSLSSKP
jgi:hypothetical protein